MEVIHNSPGKEIKLQLERDGQTLEKRLVPRLDPENKVGLIGVTPKDPKWERLSIISGIKEGIAKTYEYTALTLVGLIDMIRGKVSTNDISGPVGIIQMIDQSTRFGLVYLANLTALISISLGLFNLLPIPALDGSRLIFLLFEAVRGRPVNPNRENLVHLLGFMLLMMFMIFITYRDILKLFG